MLAEKENKVYTITEAQVSDYQNQGFDIYNDDGTVIAYGKGKTVSYEDYMNLKKEKEALQKEVSRLQEQLSTYETSEPVETKTEPKVEKTSSRGKKAGA